MAYEQKNGQGALFKNEHKQNDSHPNATGTIKVHRDLRAGETVRLAAWTKPGKDGRPAWQSLQMSDERERQEPARQEPEELDDEIPFS